jgi:sugar O-acyltransferase (sialic acid O-acetyltransferase NeuD family)
MVIAGAGGLAKEVLEIFYQRQQLDDLYFFDNVTRDIPAVLYDRFPVLRSMEEVQKVFVTTGDHSFTLGLGSPQARYRLCKAFESVNGVLVSAISLQASVGHFGNSLAPGCIVLDGAVITNGVTIGKGCLINPHVSISHDAIIGDFVEMSPGSRITGIVRVGDYSVLGTNAVILPRLTIGKNVIVGAGAVVTKDVADNCVVAGVPAVVKKQLTPLPF